MNAPLNFPIHECERTLLAIVGDNKNAGFIQKWTCDGCGARCAANEPNKLFQTAQCEHCGIVTDLRLRGCNYALLISNQRLR